MIHSHASLQIILTVRQTTHFMGALTKASRRQYVTAEYSSIAYTRWKKKKQLKRRREQEGEARKNESEIQKREVGGKNNLKL